jgi:hypothetical protein
MFREWLSDLKKLLYNKNMLVAFLLLLVLGFAFGYYFTDIIDRKSQIDIQTNELENTQKTGLSEEESNIPANIETEDIKITSNTRMIFEIKYLKSKDEDTEILMPTSELLGLNHKELNNHFVEWDIISFNSDEIVLQKSIDSYSPKHYKVGVAENDGEICIAVYYYNKEGQELVDFISDKPISILNQNEKEKFIEGMIFDDIEDVYRMLENYDL